MSPNKREDVLNPTPDILRTERKRDQGNHFASMDTKARVMRYSSLFLLLLPSLLLQEGRATSTYLGAPYLTCMRNTTSLSSTFARNLNTALRNLTSLSSQGTKYANTTAGSSGQDMVYAMFQCRGDQSLQLCWECMQNATVRLPQHECPHSVGARIQLDGCYLRYDNQSFFVLDTSYVIGYCYAPTTDAVALAAIAHLMGNVTSLAPKQSGYFASASASGEYAAAQCLGYLTESECSECLLRYSYRSVCDSTLGEQLHLTSCYYRYEPYLFFEAPSPPPPAVSPRSSPPASSPPASGGSGLSRPSGNSALPLAPPETPGSKTPIIAGGVVAGVIIVVGVLCATLVWHRKASKIKGGKKVVDKKLPWPSQLLQTKARVFSLEELEEATGHFHPSNKLGEGGFGIVYKGTLLDGEQVAIKKLSIGSQQGKQEFLNEVNLITSVQHKNLIRLWGCCVEGPERILVYEYLPNKSSDFFLFGEATDRTLNWSTRYGIVCGMAKGLAYLHEESHIRIVHRDIKPSNILLDDQLNPVIADFGLARLVKDDATHVNTRVAGTLGYLAPEYAMRGDFSEKVDVFSFGLVSLEIVTGKQTFSSSLLTWVWEKYSQEKTLDLVDEKVGNVFFPEQVIRLVHVALLCTQENPKRRPTMSMVTLWLSGMSDILEIPLKPTFVNYNDSIAPMSDSNNEFTSASFASSQSIHDSRVQRSRISGGVQSLSEIDPR